MWFLHICAQNKVLTNITAAKLPIVPIDWSKRKAIIKQFAASCSVPHCTISDRRDNLTIPYHAFSIEDTVGRRTRIKRTITDATLRR